MPSYSGLWNGVYGVNYSALVSNGNTFEQNNRTRITLTKLLSKDRGTRKLMSLMKALNGVAPGATATATYKEVEALNGVGNPIVNGGVRNIVTDNDVNRVTTAADVTLINGIFDKLFNPSPYPTDKAGNGGGNKRNSF